MYQQNYKHLPVFLKRNEIQRVPCSHFTAFSKRAKVERYVDLRATVPLLFKDSLKSQTWLFSYRSFAGPSNFMQIFYLQIFAGYSNFLTASKSEGCSPFIELF